jgi:WD40 repeat protein
VTSLQFDDNRIVSGGSDGRVKIWSLKTGQLVRELSQPAEAVWRVAFEEEKAVIVANRSNRTVMEVSFAPSWLNALDVDLSRYGRFLPRTSTSRSGTALQAHSVSLNATTTASRMITT